MGSEGVPGLLIERVSDKTGITRLVSAFGRETIAPYLFLVLVWVYDSIILSGVSFVITGRTQFESPYQLIIPVGLILGVWLTRTLRTKYTSAVRSLPGQELAEEALIEHPDSRHRLVLWVAIYLVWLVLVWASPGERTAFIELHGPIIATVKYLTVAPLYYLLFADIIALLAVSLLILPWKIYRSNLTLDFSDVTGFAGLYTTGRLVQLSAVIYYVGLTIWTIFLVAPNIAGTPSDISSADSSVFMALWLGGLLLYTTPGFLLHRHMVRQKRELIEEIDQDIRAMDPDGEEKGIPYLSPPMEDVPRIQQKYIELQQVQNTREYPANVTLVGEFVLVTFLPIVFQWAVSTGL